MTTAEIAALLDAHRALDALPPAAKEATEAEACMHNIRAVLAEHNLSVEPAQ